MYRESLAYLIKWLISPRRKPLVITGARQVGKTWLVRHLAESENKQLIEFNFEKSPELAALFDPNDPHEILSRIEQRFSLKIDPKNTILFLDEIQAKPQLYAKLRWFYEDIPELPVITAGSLLEFALEDADLSMPVGRVSFLYLEPLSFIEFLYALKKEPLVNLIKSFTWDKEIPTIIHTELMKLFKEYVFVGGLPEAVLYWSKDRSLEIVKDVHRELIGSYRSDFSKYKGNVSSDTLNEVINAIPLMVGKKFVYTKVDSTNSSAKIKEGLKLLCLARVAHKVRCTPANGVPLGAEINQRFLKAIILDVGLCSSLLNLKLSTLDDVKDLTMVNDGGIAEQVVGQLLRTIEPYNIDPTLYYWIRTKRGSDAELDYLVQHHTTVIPIEVKSGSEGSLKSLHLFMKLKKLSTAVRISSGLAQINDIQVKDNEGNPIAYQLRSLPFYLISELHRLLD